MPQRTPNNTNFLSFRRVDDNNDDDIFEVFEESDRQQQKEDPVKKQDLTLPRLEFAPINKDLPENEFFEKLKKSDALPTAKQIENNSYFKNEFGENISHLAAKYGRSEILAGIITNLKNNDNLKGPTAKSYSSSLFDIFYNNDERTVESAISKTNDKYIKDLCNEFKETLLHRACEKGFEKSVELLLKKNCDVNAIDSLLETPLHKAVQNDHIATTEILLNSSKIRIDAQNSSKETALHIACENNFKNLAKLLILKEADLNIKNEKNLTPLQIAVKNGHYDIAKLLLENGAEVDCRGQFEQTPLHIAVKNGNHDIAQLLLKNGADINAKNQLGFTALHNAVKSSDVTVDMVKLLLENKADINIKDSSNKTAFDISEEKLRSSSSNYALMEIKSMLEERQKFEASSTLKALLAEASNSSKEPIILRPLSYYKFTKDLQSKGLGVD